MEKTIFSEKAFLFYHKIGMTDAFFALYSLLIGVFELVVNLQNLTLRH